MVVGVLAILLLVYVMNTILTSHKDPPVDKTLLLNKGGLWVADFLYAVLELSAALAMAFGDSFFSLGDKTIIKGKKCVNWLRSLPLSFPSRSTLALLLDPGDRAKAFAPDTQTRSRRFDRAIVYSGLPWDPKRGRLRKQNQWMEENAFR